MTKPANSDIREEAKKAHVPHWMIAEALGVDESVFSRSLRHELLDSDKRRIRSVIQDLSESVHS